MPKGTLADADDINLLDTDFKNENWRAAAEEIQRFWEEDQLRTFVEMEEHPDSNWSRAHYQNVFHEHFEIVHDAAAAATLNIETPEELPEEYDEIYTAGFKAGVEFAADNPQLFNLE